MRDTRTPNEHDQEGESPFIKPAELAARWRISLAQAYQNIGTLIPRYRFGRSCVRAKLDDVIAFERSQTATR
jgi:hypothetical protein